MDNAPNFKNGGSGGKWVWMAPQDDSQQQLQPQQPQQQQPQQQQPQQQHHQQQQQQHHNNNNINNNNNNIKQQQQPIYHPHQSIDMYHGNSNTSMYNCKMTLKPHFLFTCDGYYPNCVIIKFKLENQKIILTSNRSKDNSHQMILEPLMETFPYSSPNQPNKLVISDIVVQIDDFQIKHPVSQEEIYHTGNPRSIKLTPNWTWLVWSSNCRSKITGVKSWVINGTLVGCENRKFSSISNSQSAWSIENGSNDDD